MSDEKNKPDGPPAGPPPAQPPPSNPPPAASSDLIATPIGVDLAPIGKSGPIFRTFEELRRFAKLVVDAGAAPKGVTPGAAVVMMVAGMERELGPLAGLQFTSVINGNLSWKAQGALALIRNSPVCKRGSLKVWVEGEGDERKGVAVAHRVDYKEPTRVEFSWADAKKAGLTAKDNWRKYPDRQLRARAIGFLARDDYSDVLGGFPLVEEAIDFEDTEASSSSSISTPPEPPPTGQPDPVLEALDAAPAVIEVEPAAEPAKTPEEQPQEKPEHSLRFKLGIQEVNPAEVIPAARATENCTYEGSYPDPAEGAQNGHITPPGEAVEPKTPAAAQEAQDAQDTHEAAQEDDQPTPPRGVQPITCNCKIDTFGELMGHLCETCKKSHLEADAELAAEESQTPLFEGEGEGKP